MLNNYRLYAKSYSNFALKCQEAYSTYELENSGKHIGDIGFKQSWIFGITIFVYIISVAAALALKFDFSPETRILFCLGELFGYICLLVLYFSLNRSIKSVDLNLLDYVVENKCTDGPLQRSIETLTFNREHDQKLVFGLAIFVFTSAAAVFSSLCLMEGIKKFLYGNRADRLAHQAFENEIPLPPPIGGSHQ